MQPRTIALCYGTRPQIIKASRLRARLAREHRVLAVDTGQHYDYELNGLLYQQLGVSPPDLCLEVGSGSHAEQTAAVLLGAERVLREHRPDVAVVIGDTNSTAGAALAAVKLRIPLVHVEAGLRARDPLMPEEINRRLVDAVASLLCAPSAAAARRLERERQDATVVFTGDIARDVLREREGCLPDPRMSLPGSVDGEYAFATLHRAELTDGDALPGVLDALAELDLPVVLALHPRTRAALEARGLEPRSRGALTIIAPVGYLESLALVRGAAVIVTDSGGIQREAYWLGVPCVTVRAETEWTETVALGANRLIDSRRPAELAPAVAAQRTRWRADTWDRDVYGAGDAAERIAVAIATL